jgi:hypothetical protein
VIPVLRPTQHWTCPNCTTEDVTHEARPHTRFHTCRGLRGLTAPLVPAGTNAAAGVASGAGTAHGAAVSLAPVSGVAEGTGTASDATVTASGAAASGGGGGWVTEWVPLETTPPTLAAAVHAAGRGQAHNATVDVHDDDLVIALLAA